jgi:hypothetical protein
MEAGVERLAAFDFKQRFWRAPLEQLSARFISRLFKWCWFRRFGERFPEFHVQVQVHRDQRVSAASSQPMACYCCLEALLLASNTKVNPTID